MSIDHDGKPIIGFAVQKSRTADKRKPFDLVIYYRGKQLAREQSANDPLADGSGGRLVNVPKAGCETIVAQTFSGGAHCCTDVFLGTRCGSKDYIIKADGGDRDPVEFHFFKDVDGDGVQELALPNRAFSYYGPDDDHFIPGAFFQGSPINYAIWTPQGWRLSRPGELRGFYKEQLALYLDTPGKSRPERNETASAAAAIEASYYALMAGETDAQARELLVRELPPGWKSIAGKVFADINKGMKDFGGAKPLTTILQSSRGSSASAKDTGRTSAPSVGEPRSESRDSPQQVTGANSIPSSADTKVLYLHEKLRIPIYAHALSALFQGQSDVDPWLIDFQKRHNGVETPGEERAIGKMTYEWYSVCQPHCCICSRLYILFEPDGKRAWAAFTRGNELPRFFGRPNEKIQDELLREQAAPASEHSGALGAWTDCAVKVERAAINKLNNTDRLVISTCGEPSLASIGSGKGPGSIIRNSPQAEANANIAYSRADVRSFPLEFLQKNCIEFSSLAKGVGKEDVADCQVIEFGDLGQLGSERYYYALYCIVVNRFSGEHTCGSGPSGDHARGVAVFVASNRSQQAAIVFKDAVAVSFGYDKPEIIRGTPIGTVLAINICSEGTAGCGANYLRHVSGGWRALDSSSFVAEMRKRLPPGLEMSSGAGLNIRDMAGQAGLYKSNDPHCCPTGGTAHVTLSLDRDKFVIRSFFIDLKQKGIIR